MASFINRAFKSYFQTVVQIIEDQPNFNIPLPLYVLLICVYFFQINGYFFNNEQTKPIYDDQFYALAKVNEVSTGMYLFKLKGNNTLTLVGFGIIQFIIYFYYVYVSLLTFLRIFHQEWLKQKQNIFVSINQVLNIFFTFYYFLFQIPFLEINFSMLSCNGRNFTVGSLAHTICSEKPLYLIILPFIGCIQTIFTGLVVSYFYRNYQFDEKVLIKRVFSYLQIVQQACFFLFMFFFFIYDSDAICYTLGFIIAIVQIFDLIYTCPYTHEILNIIYTFLTSYYAISLLILALWNYSNILVSYSILFLILIFSSMLFFVLRSIQAQQSFDLIFLDLSKKKRQFFIFNLILIFKALTVNNKHQPKQNTTLTMNDQYLIINMNCLYFKYSFLLTNPIQMISQFQETKFNQVLIKNIRDQKLYYLNDYLELLFKLTNQQMKDENSKFKIFKMLNLHHQYCTELDCICKTSNFKDKKDNLNHEDVYILIEQIFYRTLKSNLKNVDSQLIEQIYLKYITYLTRTRNRPTKAYYELKKFISHTKNTSFYFDLIKNVLASKIEKIMNMNQKMYIKTKIVDNYQETIQEELEPSQVFHTDEIVKQIIPELSFFIEKKITFWRQLLKFEKLDIASFYNVATELSKNSKKIQNLQRKYFQNISNKVTVTSNITLTKIIEIYKCTVTSDYLSAFKFSQLYSALYNRDLQKQQIIINSYNIVQGNLQTMQISLSQDLGKIISQKTEKLSHFFGYAYKDFCQINKINQLMPLYISQIHDDCVNNMIQRGFSPLISDKIQTFIKNKDSFIEPINLYLHNYQNISDDFCLQAILLKTTQQRDYIVFDESGQIQSITQNMFNLIFQKRDKYEKQIKQLFHIEGPHPIAGDQIIELKSFLFKFNIYLLIPQIRQIVKKYLQSQQSAVKMYKKLKIPQNQANLIIDASLFDQHQQICLNQNSDLFLPIRIFHLNSMFQNQFDSNIFKKTSNTEKQFSKASESIDQFFQQHQKDYDEEHVFCQFSIIFNLQKKIYSYQDQNQQNIQKKTVYIMEILEKTDLTSKVLKQNGKTERYRNQLEFDSQKTQSIGDGQLLPSIQTKEKLTYSEQTSIPSFNEINQQNQTYFESSQEIDNFNSLNSITKQTKLKKVESQRIQNRISDFGFKVDQNNYLQQNQIQKNQNQTDLQVNQTQKQAINFQTKKAKATNNSSSLNSFNFNINSNINNQSVSQKDLSYILSPDDTSKYQNDNQINRIKDESNMFLFKDLKKKQDLDLHPQNEKEQIENDQYMNSINSNRIHQEDIQQNTYTIISPRQIQSQETLMPVKESSNLNKIKIRKMSSDSLRKIERIKEKLNIFKNDSQQQDEVSQWNKLIDNAQKMVVQDSKSLNKNSKSSSSSINYQGQIGSQIKIEKQNIQKQNIGPSQTVTSRGSKLNNFSQQIIQEIIHRNSSLTNQLLMLALFIFFLGVIILFSFIFYQIVVDFLNQIKMGLINSFSTATSQQIFANQTNSAYNLFLMKQPSPIYNLNIIYQLAPIESYSCVYNSKYYNGFMNYLSPALFSYAQKHPQKTLNLELFSNQQIIALIFIYLLFLFNQFFRMLKNILNLTFLLQYCRQFFNVQTKFIEGFFLQESSSLLTCQVSNSASPKLLFNADGFYFMVSNHVYMNQQTFTIIKDEMNVLLIESEDEISSLNILFYCSIGLSSFCFMAIILIIQRINLYKQKVIILISRINTNEIECEAQKLEGCLKHLKSAKEDWLKVNFLHEISNFRENEQQQEMASFSKNRNQQESNLKISAAEQPQSPLKKSVKLMKSSSKQKQQNQLNLNKYQTSKNQKLRVLSSSFISKRIFNYKQIIIGGSIFMTGILFVGSALLIANQQNKNFQKACEIYYTIMDTIRAANSFVLVSQLLLTQLYLENNIKSLPKQNMTQVYEYYKDQISVLQVFESNFINLLSQQTQLKSYYKNQIFNVLQNDVCSLETGQIHNDFNTYYSFLLKSICENNTQTKSILENGVIGVINQYIHYGDSLKEYLSSSNFTYNQATQNQMLKIINSTIHTELITKGFYAPINSINTVVNLFNAAFQDRSDIYLTAFKVYFLVLLPILALITFAVIIIYTKKVSSDIVDINFTLTLIPYEKLLDENTINMLKQLRKYN